MMRKKQFRKMAAIMAAAMMLSSVDMTAFASAPENEETAAEETGQDRKSTRLNSSHRIQSRMPSSA